MEMKVNVYIFGLSYGVNDGILFEIYSILRIGLGERRYF